MGKRPAVASIRPYAIAAGYALLAAAAQFAMAQWVGVQTTFTLFFPAIVAAALLGVGPGALALALSLVAGWADLSSARAAQVQRGDALALVLLGVAGAMIVLMVLAYRRTQTSFNQMALLFKAARDISLEGVVVYRALLDPEGRISDFEYRYANPAARTIMLNRGSGEIVGKRLLDRLPPAREHPELFPRYVRVFTTGETSEAEYELGGRWYRSTAAKLGDALVVTVQDVSIRRRAEDAQKLRVEELNHRVKNLLASVIAMADVSERGATSTAEFRDKLSARLLALSRAHSLLMAGAWTDAAVEDVVQNTLEPYLTADAGRFRIEGPKIGVSPDVALALNMALHELATNAIKYGALSNQRGQIEIRWELDPDRPHFALLTWTESDGPPVSKPNSGGFGTRLLQRAFAATDGKVKLHFLTGGLFCEMRFAAVVDGLTVAQEAGRGPALEEPPPQ